MPFVSRAGARIHYETCGRDHAGTPVILVQGLGLSSRFWFDVPDTLANDPSHPRRVLVLDNRGSGRSSRPTRPFSIGTMADDVAAVLDAEQISAAIIVGISMGGMIAQQVALRHPARVAGLLLLATSPGLLAGGFPDPRSVARLLSLPFAGPGASTSLLRLLLPRSKWPRAREIFAEWPEAMRVDPTEHRTFVAHLLAAALHHVARSEYARLGCPALVVAGADDVLMPKRYAEALARRIPGAELLVLPDTGHALFAEDRDLVRRLVARVEAKI